MKAKFGKTSIGCFLGNFAILFGGALIVTLFEADDEGWLFYSWIVSFSLLAFVGFAFATIGIIKESPKIYSIIGFFLNLAFLISTAFPTKQTISISL